jgi:SAM-dependent methyltransferase
MTRTADFNGLARLYRWMEFFSFGPWLSMTRRTFIGQLAGSRRALVLGDGDGRFTAMLLRYNRAVSVDAVDASPAMLQALLRRSGEFSNRVQVHLEDVREWAVPAPIAAMPYDLIATHFFLDCLTTREVNLLAAKIRLAASPGALWVVSEFAIPAGWFGRLVARPVVAGLYFSFRLLTGLEVRTLPDHEAAFCRAGFTLKERKSRLAGLLVAELWCAATPIEA